MKINLNNKKMQKNALALALTFAGVLQAFSASNGAVNASIKGDSDLTAMRSSSEKESSQKSENATATERVSDDEAHPENAEIARNRDFDAGKINEPSVQDSLEEPKESAPKIAESPALIQNQESQNEPKIASSEIANEQKAEENEIENAHSLAEADSLEEGEPEIEDAQIVPSRTVTMKNNQRLSITYPGRGWAFLGEIDTGAEAAHLTFLGKSLGREDTDFSLRSKKCGETLLHFYKTDSLTGRYIDDYLLVKIEGESENREEEVVAPLYAAEVPAKPDMSVAARKVESVDANTEGLSPLPEIPSATSAEITERKTEIPSIQDDGVRTVIQETSQKEAENEGSSLSASEEGGFTNVFEKNSAPAIVETASLFEKAQEAFNEGKLKEAIALAQAALEAMDESDRALFLLGQAFEAKSEERNIRRAIESYDALVQGYPASDLWVPANQRLIFLRRFYIDIR